MTRWLRAIVSLLFALALVLAGALGAAPARAAEPPSAGVAAKVDGAPLLLPRDVPVVVSAANADVPKVPADYVTRDLGWLRFSYPSPAGERVASLLRDADAIKGELQASLGQEVLDHVEIRVVPTVADMADLAPASSPPPAYASGVAYPRLRLVLLSMLAPHGGEAVDLDEVFRHELAHVALEDAVRGQHVPVWFNEGLAIGLSGEKRIDREKTLWSATLSGTLLPFAELDRAFPAGGAEVSVAYAESADFMRFLRRRTDEMRFSAMIRRVRDGEPFERAVSDAYGSDLRKLEFQWRTDVERRYSVIPILTGGGIVWVAVIGGLVVAYVRKRRRARRILARWEREEAIEDARLARRAAELEALGPVVAELVPASVRAMPAKIEHDGGWHTLH